MSTKKKKKGTKRQAESVITMVEDDMDVSDNFNSDNNDEDDDDDDADSDIDMEVKNEQPALGGKLCLVYMFESDTEATENIDVEFEAVTPNESDFHGIKQLLLRTFVMLHVDVSDMSDLIISQNNIGSTMKIVDDEDDEVYGIVTILNMKKYQHKTCIKELKKQLTGKCKSNNPAIVSQFENVLNNKKVGYMVNERFINLPQQIALPFHTSIRTELDEALKQDSSFDIDYILLISKTLKPTTAPIKPGAASDSSSSKLSAKKKKTKQLQPLRSENETDYTNFEEECFHEEAELSFSYCVTQATGLAVGGDWDFTDQPMNSYRTVYLVPKSRWENILSKMAKMLESLS